MRFFFHNRKKSSPSPKQDQQSGMENRTARIQAAQTAERRLELILNTLYEGVLVMDKDLMLQLVNPKARILFGIDEHFRGISLLEATRSTELESLAQQVLVQNRFVEQDMKLYTPRDQRYFQVSAAPLHNPAAGEAKPEELVIVLAEVTRLHKLEQVRKDFAANVSHELRTPIQLIKGFAETLLDTPLEDKEQVRHFIEIILRNAQTMENLTTDLLSLVSLEEEGNFPFAMQETLVYPLLKEAFAAVELTAQKQDIRIFLQCPPELKAVLYGPFIIQGVINLLDNGIKYSSPGSRVWLEAAVQGDTNQELVISVRDEGIGIPAKHLGRIFERFYRVDRARSRSQGGTGLGLAIVRHIALVHQGVAEAESHAGEGSVFRIRIPMFRI
jgi:two-component system phosphate regulon sensor histidine kinase PhoR